MIKKNFLENRKQKIDDRRQTTDDSKQKRKIKLGIYKHFKGGEYQVLNIGKHSETKEEFVVYQSLKDKDKICIRPKKMFEEKVKVDGKKVPRFEFKHEVREEDFEHKYKRALADYQNLVKQTAKEKQEFVKFANEQFLHEILPVYDNLKLALIHAKSMPNNANIKDGVKYVIKQFKDVLSAAGVEEIETVGKKFDHHTMEAVEGKGDKVVKEVKPGYKLRGKVIVAAKVVVG